MDNHQAARRLALLGDLIELVESQPFKSRAYHNASRSLKGLADPYTDLLSRGTLSELPGFGRAVVSKLEELEQTGRLLELDELKSKIPPGVLIMRRVSGLGAKKLRALYQDHGIDTLDTLEQAARDGSLADLPGFGAKSVLRIEGGIAQVRSFFGRMRLPEARRLAAEVQSVLAASHADATVLTAGDVRRHMETVSALNWIVTGRSAADAADLLVQQVPDCDAVTEEGDGTLRLRFQDGVTGAVRFVPRGRDGWAWLEATGPDGYVQHVASCTALREGDEASILRDAGLPDLPAECRDLPSFWTEGVPDELIEWRHLRGVLHCHTDYSDGLVTLKEMAEAARTRGLGYIGICDHSQTAGYAGGLKPDRVRKQRLEIDRLNEEYGGEFRIFKGIESDILADGSLDYDEETLASFDFVVASIHSGLDMLVDEATDRICRALAHPYTTMLGHATGRLLLQRWGYELCWERVIDTARQHGVVIELNANPRRLDVDWRHLRDLYAAGMKTAINPDAHVPDGIDDMRYGVDIARKAGTTAERVLNTMETDDIARYFQERKP